MREEKKQWMGPLILPEKKFFFPGNTSQANFHLPLIVTETALGPKSKTLRIYLRRNSIHHEYYSIMLSLL